MEFPMMRTSLSTRPLELSFENMPVPVILIDALESEPSRETRQPGPRKFADWDRYLVAAARADVRRSCRASPRLESPCPTSWHATPVTRRPRLHQVNDCGSMPRGLPGIRGSYARTLITASDRSPDHSPRRQNSASSRCGCFVSGREELSNGDISPGNSTTTFSRLPKASM